MNVLALGDYSTYIWTCYALSFAVMVIVTFTSVRALRVAKATIARLQKPVDADEA